MLVTEIALYHLSRMLYRAEVAHSSAMKGALSDPAAYATYRAAEVARVLAAAKRFGLCLAGADILDLGCNDGALTIQYVACGPRSVVACDVDAEAVALARRLRSAPGIEYRVSSTTELPLEPDAIDIILCYDVFEHVSKPAVMLAECRRVLRPGGRMLIGTWGWYHPFAPHLWSTMPVPWAHIVVSERTLLRACRRVYHAPWYVTTFHDFDADGKRMNYRYTEDRLSTDYLNKYLVRDFERAFRESGLHWRVRLQPFGSRWTGWTKPLLRIPYVREFVHGYLWALLEKPAAAAPIVA